MSLALAWKAEAAAKFLKTPEGLKKLADLKKKG